MERDSFNSIQSLDQANCTTSAHLVCHILKWDDHKLSFECHPCQAFKTYCHVYALHTEHPPLGCQLGNFHVYFVGPLDRFEGMNYNFTLINSLTQWPEAILLVDNTTEICARTFIHHWISLYEVPNDITACDFHGSHSANKPDNLAFNGQVYVHRDTHWG